MNPPGWFGLSRRLRRYLYCNDLIFGCKWSKQGGQWVMLIIKKKDAYLEVDS